MKSSYRSSFIYVNSLLIFEVEFEVIYLDFFHNFEYEDESTVFENPKKCLIFKNSSNWLFLTFLMNFRPIQFCERSEARKIEWDFLYNFQPLWREECCWTTCAINEVGWRWRGWYIDDETLEKAEQKPKKSFSSFNT